jgi:hypothetical protein
MDEKNLDILFKPVQLRILKKVTMGNPLNENEKRYLRGGLGKKLNMLQSLLAAQSSKDDQLSTFLKTIGEYYITGYEALKHNGYGWYFDTKRIVVMNTRIEGHLRIGSQQIILKRVKSLGRKDWKIDPENGLKYATNERIYHDARSAHQEDLVKVWVDLLDRYGGMFVPRPERYEHLIPKKAPLERLENCSL